MSLRKFFVALFVTLVIISCTMWAENPGRTYAVYIDPSFSPQQRQMVRAGYEEWSEASNWYFRFEETSYKDTGVVIRVWANTVTQLHRFGPNVIGETWHDGESSDIYLPVDFEDWWWFEHTARHEFGHALGAKHIDAGNVMCGYNQSQSESITCADVKEVCRHWDTTCVPQNMPACMWGSEAGE